MWPSDYGLWLLGQCFRELNSTLADARLPTPRHEWVAGSRNQHVLEALSYDVDDQSCQLSDKLRLLNQRQLAAFNTITDAIRRSPANAHFFLQGPAGTGKTFLYETLCNLYRSEGHVVICVASSAIAAQLLPGGTTSHSRFKIPIVIDGNSTCSLSKQSAEAQLLRIAKLIIWDEVTLQNKHCFAAVDRTLRDIMSDDRLFGGIPVLLGGDFAQILPVVRKGKRADVVNACIQLWREWTSLTQLHLTLNMRVRETSFNNAEFAMWLSTLSYSPQLRGAIQLPPYIRHTADPEEFIRALYPQHLLAVPSPSLFVDRAILASKNDTVDLFNGRIGECTPGFGREYLAADKVEDVETGGIRSEPTSDFLQALAPSGFPAGRLHLKVGMPIMLIRNYYPKRGLCNGTRLIVTKLFSSCIKAKIMSKDPTTNGCEHVISRIDLSTSEDIWFTLRRRQLPVRVCYAMTINKSQGQTLSHVGVDLSTPVFSHGQLYVALSRVTDVRELIVLFPPLDQDQQRVRSQDVRCIQPKTDNIVYPEVLLAAPSS